MIENISEETVSGNLPPSYEERSEEDKTCSRVGQEAIQQAKQPSCTQQFLYEVSLSYTKWTSNEWWSKIEPLNLYLGAIPLKNQGHLEQIAALGITDVLSIVEDFELADGWINSPAKKEDWEALGVQVKQIPAVDFYPLTQQEIQEGIEHLHTLLQEGKTVYVHCKAGRGRSATVVIAYLMKYHGLSFDHAFSTVKEARSVINLNAGQQQAIFDYFSIDSKSPETSELISQETLKNLLSSLLTHVIHGGSFSAEGNLPDSIATWVPNAEIQSTLQRRNRYLREYQGNQEEAVEASIQRNNGLSHTFKKFAVGAIPVIGTPTHYTISVWHQLREITLIAALHGHDLEDPEVQMKILSCLVGGNLLKVPAQSIDLVAQYIIEQAAQQTVGLVLPIGLPAHIIFNYFTDNSAKVSTHAKEVFAGENSILIPPEDYL